MQQQQYLPSVHGELLCHSDYEEDCEDQYEHDAGCEQQGDSEAAADRSPSPVKDQQPGGAAGAAAAGPTQESMLATARFWVSDSKPEPHVRVLDHNCVRVCTRHSRLKALLRTPLRLTMFLSVMLPMLLQAHQHEADRRHASSNVMIQHLQQKSLELHWRMERIRSKILSGQQQQQQQQQQEQQSRAAHISLAPGNIQPADLSMQRSQELADRLLVMLDQQQQQQQQGPPVASKQAQQEAAAAQHIPGSASRSASMHAAGSSQTDAVAVAAAVAAAIAAERSGQLSAEGSKAWQQKLREQLLGSSSVEPGDGGLKQHLQQQQQQQQQLAVTATAAGGAEQAVAEGEGLSSKAKVSHYRDWYKLHTVTLLANKGGDNVKASYPVRSTGLSNKPCSASIQSLPHYNPSSIYSV
jgi:hypothetical protein